MPFSTFLSLNNKSLPDNTQLKPLKKKFTSKLKARFPKVIHMPPKGPNQVAISCKWKELL